MMKKLCFLKGKLYIGSVLVLVILGLNACTSMKTHVVSAIHKPGPIIRVFPDLTKFTEKTITPGMKPAGDSIPLVSAVQFYTSEGVNCQIMQEGSSSSLFNCFGDDPEYLPTNLRTTRRHRCMTYLISSMHHFTPGDADSNKQNVVQLMIGGAQSPEVCTGPHHDQSDTLPVGFKVSLGDVVCARGEDHMLACTNHVHGFVLRPDDIWLF